MNFTYSEALYPIDFRKSDAEKLGQAIGNRQSVEIVGMKRVGIGNFLRFFLHHEKIIPNYVRDGKKHLFITLDLNDLVECSLFPFWQLFLKRILDHVNNSEINSSVKQKINDLFTTNLQTKDLFLTIETVRVALQEIVKADYLPTVFILRFDRLVNAATPHFFSNLQSLVEATRHKLCYVMTSYRILNDLMPDVCVKTSLCVFLKTLYLKPAEASDLKKILATMEAKYRMTLAAKIKQDVITLSAGHVQYLQLSLIILHELQNSSQSEPPTAAKIGMDERILLQSEEIVNSLTPSEKKELLKITGQSTSNNNLKIVHKYLFETGIVNSNGRVFSSYLNDYLVGASGQNYKVQSALTRKEELLYGLLVKNKDKVLSRIAIQETVWPEYSEIGVSDWAIDRLVHRLRNKLQAQNKRQRIVTLRTKGFMLSEY